MPDAWLHIGKVASVNVARRRVRVSVMAGNEHEFADREHLWLAVGADAPVQLRVSHVRVGGVEAIVELTPGVSRDMAAGLKGANVVVPAASRRAPADAFPALHELTGMRVVTATGVFVGSVVETLDTAAGGVIRLQCADMIMAVAPVTGAFIRDIDLEAGVMTVNDPTPFLVFEGDDRDGNPSQVAT